MKYRPSLILIAAFLTSMSYGVARADEAPAPAVNSPGVDPQWNPAKMQKKFGLSSDQVTKLKTVMNDEKSAMKPLKDTQRDLMKTLVDQVQNKAKDTDIQTTLTTLKTNHETMRLQKEKFMTQKESILTPTQQAKMLLAKMKHMRKWMHKGPLNGDQSEHEGMPHDESDGDVLPAH